MLDLALEPLANLPRQRTQQQAKLQLHRDARHWSAPWLFPGTWAAMGGVSTGGALTHWFCEQIAQKDAGSAAFEELALSREILTEDALDAAGAVLGERNGADALLAQYETARDRATEGTT